MSYTRIVVVDYSSQPPDGILLERWYSKNYCPHGVKVRVEKQDDGRTLKLFIEDDEDVAT